MNFVNVVAAANLIRGKGLYRVIMVEAKEKNAQSINVRTAKGFLKQCRTLRVESFVLLGVAMRIEKTLQAVKTPCIIAPKCLAKIAASPCK